MPYKPLAGRRCRRCHQYRPSTGDDGLCANCRRPGDEPTGLRAWCLEADATLLHYGIGERAGTKGRDDE